MRGLSGVMMVLLLAGAGAPGAQDRPAEIPDWVRAVWERQTQGTGRWVADNSKYKSKDEPWDAYGIEWTWGLGKQSVRGRLFGIAEGKEGPTFWEFHSYWHPGRRELVLTQFGGNGTIGIGIETPPEKGVREALQRFHALDGSSFQVGHRTKEAGLEDQGQSFDVTEDGKWTPRREYVWKPVESPRGERPPR